MSYKLQLYRSPGDDPIAWQNFIQYLREQLNQIGFLDSKDVNPYLKKYRATYYIIQTDIWDDYVIFDSESDYMLFMLTWS